jgi:putative flippase GtrA
VLGGKAFLYNRPGAVVSLDGDAAISLLPGTLLAAEVTAVMRYAVNDLWVFSEQRPAWILLWQFHVANAEGFAIWWALTAILARAAIYNLIASGLGTAEYLLLSMATNFIWIWHKCAPAVPCQQGPPGER